MEKQRQFLIDKERLIALAMELAALVHSHEEMCEWLGPYDELESENYVAQYYKNYYEERLSYLLLTLALLLRTLDDRRDLGEYFKKIEPMNAELGRIRVDGAWREIGNFRTEALNFLIHAEEVITNPEIKTQVYGTEDYPILSDSRWLGKSIVLTGKLHGRETASVELNLRAFCDMTFRAFEYMRGSDQINTSD